MSDLPPMPSVLRARILDSGPLSLAANPKKTLERDSCLDWLDTQLADGLEVVIPEIADYEVRRELIRAGKTASLTTLDQLADSLTYLPLNTAMLHQAAQFWAQARLANRQMIHIHLTEMLSSPPRRHHRGMPQMNW